MGNATDERVGGLVVATDAVELLIGGGVALSTDLALVAVGCVAVGMRDVETGADDVLAAGCVAGSSVLATVLFADGVLAFTGDDVGCCATGALLLAVDALDVPVFTGGCGMLVATVVD